MWYCPKCLLTLPDYVRAPGVKDELEALNTKIDNLTKMNTEQFKLTKTFSEVVSDGSQDSGAASKQLKATADRLETRLRQDAEEREKLIRKSCAIIHRVPESQNTHNAILDMVSALNIACSNVRTISRLGRRNNTTETNSYNRPVKVEFTAEVVKIDIMKAFNKWTHRAGCFATLDLTKEERDVEYQLRKKRNELKESNPHNNYSVRNGSLYVQINKTGNWILLDKDGNEPTPLESTRPNATIKTSNHSY